MCRTIVFLKPQKVEVLIITIIKLKQLGLYLFNCPNGVSVYVWQMCQNICSNKYKQFIIFNLDNKTEKNGCLDT